MAVDRLNCCTSKVIVRDYQELKSELGLSHYEGRNWRGFHYHAALCIAAYGFLMLERLRGKKTPLDSSNLPYQRFPAPRVWGRCSVTTPGRSPPRAIARMLLQCPWCGVPRGRQT